MKGRFTNLTSCQELNDLMIRLSHAQKMKEKIVDIEVVKREAMYREEERCKTKESEESDERV